MSHYLGLSETNTSLWKIFMGVDWKVVNYFCIEKLVHSKKESLKPQVTTDL